MFYRALENFLSEDQNRVATREQVEALDDYLAGLSSQNAQYVTPWRVAQNLGMAVEPLVETMLFATSKGIATLRYEVVCPETRITIYETFDQSNLERAVPCGKCSLEEAHLPTDETVYISFRLNEILGNPSKKKPGWDTTHLTR